MLKGAFHMPIHPRGIKLILSTLGVAIAASAWGQGDMKSMAPEKSPAPKAPAPIRTTMEALHASGGVPKGWKFLMPLGDAGKGREVFVTMECFACHDVKGENFPKDTKRGREPGPELTGMGSHHPAEYFAESIVNPNRVIVQGAGYTGADGLSKMPGYGDTMTVQQLVDVVAYLKSLKGGMHDMQEGGSKKPMGMKGHDMK
jgi:mono/diheme cytochrome c family protein